MNHDYCHCLDYDKNSCPPNCFRAELAEDLKKHPIEIPLTYSHLKNTNLCLKFMEGKKVKKFVVGQVVQFNETHKWCGCFGFVNEVKDCGNDTRYMIGVPVPQQGTAYIFTMESKREIEATYGVALFLPKDKVDEMGEETI